MIECEFEYIKNKLNANGYVMSCYLTQADLYADMKKHIEMLVEEVEFLTGLFIDCSSDE